MERGNFARSSAGASPRAALWQSATALYDEPRHSGTFYIEVYQNIGPPTAEGSCSQSDTWLGIATNSFERARAHVVDGAKAASLLALGCGASDASAYDGRFFRPSSPETPFLLSEGTGTPITVRGRIVDAHCEPIAGALIDFWQADEAGAHDAQGFLYRGHQVVGADGRYQLTTIIPGRYLNGSQYRPAHVHCKVLVGGVELLTTQLYFEGDPFNEVDPWFSEATMLRPQQTNGALSADFDFSVSS